MAVTLPKMHGLVLLIPLGRISLDCKVQGDLSSTLIGQNGGFPLVLCHSSKCLSQMQAYILFAVILQEFKLRFCLSDTQLLQHFFSFFKERRKKGKKTMVTFTEILMKYCLLLNLCSFPIRACRLLWKTSRCKFFAIKLITSFYLLSFSRPSQLKEKVCVS